MRITVVYSSIDDRHQRSDPTFRSTIEVSAGVPIEKLIANLGVDGLSKLVEGQEQEPLTSGQLEENVTYRFSGYNAYKMKEKIGKRFPGAVTELLSP